MALTNTGHLIHFVEQRLAEDETAAPTQLDAWRRTVNQYRTALDALTSEQPGDQVQLVRLRQRVLAIARLYYRHPAYDRDWMTPGAPSTKTHTRDMTRLQGHTRTMTNQETCPHDWSNLNIEEQKEPISRTCRLCGREERPPFST